MFRDLGDRYEESVALTHLGDTYHVTGSPAATAAWRQALDTLIELNHTDADDVRARLSHLPPTACGG